MKELLYYQKGTVKMNNNISVNSLEKEAEEQKIAKRRLISKVLKNVGVGYYAISLIISFVQTGNLYTGIIPLVIFLVLLAASVIIEPKSEPKETEDNAVTVESEAEAEEPAALADAPTSEVESVESAPVPESVVITCEKCGQTMIIPSGSGAVKVTCPKCGSDIIHTYSN